MSGINKLLGKETVKRNKDYSNKTHILQNFDVRGSVVQWTEESRDLGSIPNFATDLP